MSQSEADNHLSVAQRQLGRVQTASWDPDDQDREDAITWGFYSYENGVLAVAEKANIAWKPTHWNKLDLADQIQQGGLVSINVRKRIEQLNDLRKNIQYGEAGPDLKKYDLADLVTELETFLDEVDRFVRT